MFIFWPFIFLQIAVGWWFIQYLLNHDRGAKEPKRMLIASGLLGVLSVAIAFGLELLFISHKLTNTQPQNVHKLGLSFLLFNSFLIGLIEEGSKTLPVFLLIRKKKYFNEMTDGIIYFGIAGMVFGVLESIEYTIFYGYGAGLGKIITGPFTHAALASITGYAVARHKVLEKSIWQIGLAFLFAALVHGFYDFGLFNGGWTVLSSLAITVILNIGVFFLFKRAQKHDEKLGLSAVGQNQYCRNCGWPNRYHYLYCLHCGQKT